MNIPDPTRSWEDHMYLLPRSREHLKTHQVIYNEPWGSPYGHKSPTCLGDLPISGSDTLRLCIVILLPSAALSPMGSIAIEGISDDTAIVD